MENKKIGRFFSFMGKQEPSISKNLALSLSFIIFLVLAALLGILYINYSQDMLKDIEEKADEHIARITAILASPVWNLDEKTITGIGTEYTHSELVHYIRVVDIDNTIMFEFKYPPDEFVKIKRSGNIKDDKQLIGYVEISLTMKKYEKELSRIIKATSLMFIGSALVIYLATGILLRIFLRKPLYELHQGMVNAARGDFSYKFEYVQYKELSGIMQSFIQMTRIIKDRENAFELANKMLKEEISERIRAENINRALFNISNAVNTTQNLDDLYKFIHRALSTVIDVSNFYIALYSSKNHSISFPYYVDEANSDFPDINDFNEFESLTGKVILTKEPVLIKPGQILEDSGSRLRFQGTIPQVWMGVPLIVKGEVVGVIATQSYTSPDQYNESDLEIFLSVSGQVAIAVERKRAEKALRESEYKFKNLFDMSPQVIFLEEIETGKIIDANMEFCNLTNLKIKDLINKSTTDLKIFSKPDKEMFIHNIEQNGEVRGMEMAFMAKDGIPGQAIVSAKIIQLEEKLLILNVLTDITEQKKALKEKESLQESLARSKKMEALGLLAGGVAHDLNNILSGIVSYPDLLLLDIPYDSKFRKPIETIKASGQRAAAVVSDLLTLARGIACTKEIMNLNHILEEYLQSPEFATIKYTYPKIKININANLDLFNISCSSIHLKKVLMNLVNNAVEAIEHEKGEIIISTGNRYIDRPLKGYDQVRMGEYAVLSVSDNGSGISHDDLERIFEPFYTRKVMGRSGTGLGLSVVWNTIQDHEGYIDVKSSSKGTVFELYFPVVRKEISNEKKDITIEDYLGNGENILVIDDEQHQQAIACRLLCRLGYNAEAVGSGLQAVEYLKNHDVDLVLLDMIMPEMNGSETYERIVKNTPGQKALIASGFAETSDVKKAQKMGAGAYIKKPYTIEKIGMAVKAELEK